MKAKQISLQRLTKNLEKLRNVTHPAHTGSRPCHLASSVATPPPIVLPGVFHG